ncbi:hypothetical protein PP589_gp23 [Pseudoalteromonas phage HS5]|nr:hypothetical protein PP589_gp23 [Pseudoalteromonas phage HS5]
MASRSDIARQRNVKNETIAK